jgi:SpoVK/Ycf46/Vps4 family AAA+-type ATPase
LHGPTGNGKTTIARHIAYLTGLPFVEVNSDSLIDSKLGSTSTNIHKLFSQIKGPCVLFWDEVDSIGRRRAMEAGDNAAGYENDRMVNSILVNLEKMDNDVIFIGATNRYDVLDTAFLRRFDLSIEIPAPTDQQKSHYVDQLVRHYNLPDTFRLDERVWSQPSYSALKLAFISAARKFVASTIASQPCLKE